MRWRTQCEVVDDQGDNTDGFVTVTPTGHAPGSFLCYNSLVKQMTASMAQIQQDAVKIEWSKVFKASFMLLFIAYPGTGPSGVTTHLQSCFPDPRLCHDGAHGQVSR